ncbi:GNAT family N-acetyltransferase [Methylocystis parvus]|uniref:GNAT family N-acetyltransferase n=1 Tax=Methylocystis parvus TaxID=134 RepID=A0A6B8M1S8_9HYPH|nr:GNAT family N-acetyltransferase [Methylocystis parvus]QGM96298.1 GNAT family N-acetyltransferase [Methylocystis parvus]WBJ99864.1 GNAT family N-acetyltransferase [Methylocystis parvus OBBP]
MTIVRDISEQDAQAWRALWAGYNAFYETVLPPDVTAHTFNGLLDPSAPMIGRVVEVDGRVAGFSISILHACSWSIAPVCYLEDLFVDPACRRKGLGKALIEDLVELGREKGWSRLYWHTKAGNAQARRLYDLFVPADDFVRYRLKL